MKKVTFGFSNEQNPTGSIEGIGIDPGTLLVDADYYGFVTYENTSYLVSKITEDPYGNYPDLVNRFLVRPALADLYPDGSGTLYLNQEQSLEGQAIESRLNIDQIKDKINGIDDIFTYCPGISRSNNALNCLAMNETVPTVSITNEAFGKKQELLSNCRGTFSELQERIELNNDYSL